MCPRATLVDEGDSSFELRWGKERHVNAASSKLIPAKLNVRPLSRMCVDGPVKASGETAVSEDSKLARLALGGCPQSWALPVQMVPGRGGGSPKLDSEIHDLQSSFVALAGPVNDECLSFEL